MAVVERFRSFDAVTNVLVKRIGRAGSTLNRLPAPPSAPDAC